MQFAAKEASRFTSKIEEQDSNSAKRLARYLKDNRRVVIEHQYQKLPERVIAWSEADFADCRRAGRSTSGFVVMFGKHSIKTRSPTQETVALSSGESEFYGIAKAATVGRGMKGLTADLGLQVEVQINTDSIERSKKHRITKGSGENEAH